MGPFQSKESSVFQANRLSQEQFATTVASFAQVAQRTYDPQAVLFAASRIYFNINLNENPFTVSALLRQMEKNGQSSKILLDMFRLLLIRLTVKIDSLSKIMLTDRAQWKTMADAFSLVLFMFHIEWNPETTHERNYQCTQMHLSPVKEFQGDLKDGKDFHSLLPTEDYKFYLNGLRLIILKGISLRTSLITRSDFTLTLIAPIRLAAFVLYTELLLMASSELQDQARLIHFKENVHICTHMFFFSFEYKTSGVGQLAILIMSFILQKSAVAIEFFPPIATSVYKKIPIFKCKNLHSQITCLLLYSMSLNPEGQQRMKINYILGYRLLLVLTEGVAIPAEAQTILADHAAHLRLNQVERAFIYRLLCVHLLNKNASLMPYLQKFYNASGAGFTVLTKGHKRDVRVEQLTEILLGQTCIPRRNKQNHSHWPCLGDFSTSKSCFKTYSRLCAAEILLGKGLATSDLGEQKALWKSVLDEHVQKSIEGV